MSEKSETPTPLPFPILPGEAVPICLQIANNHIALSHIKLQDAVNTVLVRLNKISPAAMKDALRLHEAVKHHSMVVQDFLKLTLNEVGQHNHLTYYNEKWLGICHEHNENVARINRNEENLTQSMIRLATGMRQLNDHFMPPDGNA